MKAKETLCTKFTLKGQGRSIHSNSDMIEPLCYTLLFSFAKSGWCTDISDTVSFVSSYMYSRLKISERTYESVFDDISNDSSTWGKDNPQRLLRKWNKKGDKLLATNSRFQLMTRVSQHYLVEQFSRALDFRLNWNKKKKGNIFGQHSLHEGTGEEDDAENLGNDDMDGEDGHHGNTGEVFSIIVQRFASSFK